MYGRLLFGDLAAVNQGLHIGMVHGALNEPAAVEVVDAGITGVGPVAVALGVNQKSCQRAMRLFF